MCAWRTIHTHPAVVCCCCCCCCCMETHSAVRLVAPAGTQRIHSFNARMQIFCFILSRVPPSTTSASCGRAAGFTPYKHCVVSLSLLIFSRTFFHLFAYHVIIITARLRVDVFFFFLLVFSLFRRCTTFLT